MPPDYVHAKGGQQLLRRLQARGRVVVARDDANGQLRQRAPRLGQKVVIQRLRLRRGAGLVEHIAGNQQRIHLALLQGAQQPLEKQAVLVRALVPGQGLAQMPVGGVKEFHGGAIVRAQDALVFGNRILITK